MDWASHPARVQNTDQTGSVIRSMNGLVKMLVVTLGIRICGTDDINKRLSFEEGILPSIQEGRGYVGRPLRYRTGSSRSENPRSTHRTTSRCFWYGRAVHVKTPLDLCGSGGDGSLALNVATDTTRLLLLGDYVKQDDMVHDTKRSSSNSAQDDKRPWSQARSVEPLQP